MTDRRLQSKLGFDKVLAAVSNRCQTEYAADRVETEQMSTSAGEINSRLQLTDEMRLVLMFEDGFPSTGYIDSLPFLKPLLEEGYSIDKLSLAKLGTLRDLSRKITVFFSGVKDGVYPRLKHMSASLACFVEVRRRIDCILDKYGEIRDSASVQLEKIRKDIRSKESVISKKANSALLQAKADGVAEADAQVVLRDGKFLLPVNTSEKRRVNGFVYDCSASGKTTFIEPAEVVEIENDLSELHFEETREIARILYEFSEFLRPYVPDLIKSSEIIGEYDFLIAKANTALDYVSGMPVISDSGVLDLRKARHPLLESALKREKKEMCPLTISLNPSKRILLISGPNAGGKSVCLKTAGLLQYMMQWGMLVPTSESSELPVFDRIMVSIGDDQSLENDLSTYSSFLSDMREMLRHADEKTMVLIDEFGAGTDPAAGGAIAEAILAELDRRGAYGVITTHYSNLKLYASNTQSHVINGAMLYDTSRIEPLFKLETGLPGNSFAFELARKMQLPESIVKDAENRAGDNFVGLERNLRRIARGRRVLDEKIKKVQHTDKALEGLTEKYQAELEDIQARRKEILDSAREEAQNIVKDAGKQVERTIREIKEAQADKEKTRAARSELQGFVSALESRKSKQEAQKEEYLQRKMDKLGKHRRPSDQQSREQEFRSAPLKIGEKVRIKSNMMVGEVVTVSSKSITVVVGAVSTRLDPSKVERISNNEYKDASRKTLEPSWHLNSDVSARKLQFHPEIDIRGQRLSEAMDVITHYIDDAIMLGMSSVRIIHGKGTGVLREEIQKYLRTVPGVASAQDEDIRQGGTGVTIVNFE